MKKKTIEWYYVYIKLGLDLEKYHEIQDTTNCSETSKNECKPSGS